MKYSLIIDSSPHTSLIFVQHMNGSKMQMKRMKTSERKKGLFHLFFCALP